MSRITAATLLLLVLVDGSASRMHRQGRFKPFTSEHHVDLLELTSAGFTLNNILRCRCKPADGGRMLCPRPLIPTDVKAKEELKKCLCRQTTEHCRPKIQEYCKSRCFLAAPPL